ncbi:MAG: hypothetical protein ACON4H_17395 [Rubripirellula sp.]
MQDNPYQPPPDTNRVSPERQQTDTNHSTSAAWGDLQGNGTIKRASSNQHHFWIALAACPLAGPILTILMITGLGFLYQASGTEGSQQANPMSLIFFPIIGLLITVPLNYVAMAVTFLPAALFLRNRDKLKLFYILVSWALSLIQIAVIGVCLSVVNAVAFERGVMSRSFTLSGQFGVSLAMAFAPITLISVFTFWLLNLRGRTSSKTDADLT